MTAIGIGGGFLGPVWMNWARQLTGDYQRGLLLLAVPSIVAGVLILWLNRLAAKATAFRVEDMRRHEHSAS
jgi:ACS family tartrate transporter-like MFS transporter